MNEKPVFLVCVDEKEHSRVAMRFACLKAMKAGCRVALIYVIEHADFNTFQALAGPMEASQQAEAETLLFTLAKEAEAFCGVRPACLIRRGLITEQIVATMEEQPEIHMLVLGAAPDGSSARTRILSTLTSQMGLRIHIPLLIVPGDLTDKQMQDLT